MAKFLKSVETLMAQVLISVYGEVLLVTGIAYHNQKDNCVGVDFYVSERQGDHLNFCVGFTRMNRSAEADADLETMWKNCIDFDSKWGKHFRYHTPLYFVCIPGTLGRKLTALSYRICNKIVRFN